MAEDAGVRNARGQSRLRAMGLDPGPLRGAYNRYRKASGVARGLSASQAVGKPRKGERSVTDMLPPEVRLRRGKQPRRDVVFRHGLGTVVQTFDQRHFRATLRQAAGRGDRRVGLRVTATDGRVTQTRAVDTERHRSYVDRRVFAARGRRMAPDHPEVTVVGKPQLTLSPDGRLFESDDDGLDPAELLAFLATYDSWLAALGDLWAEEYHP